MQKLFRITDTHGTEQVPSAPSTSEADHLHKLIEHNLDLLPGEQIDPDDPVRWLLIKSEVPVEDPESGVQRWSLDLLLADQWAKPALVECKLVKNAEIRKEMIGQAIEYAANAQHYWDAESLKRYAEATHGGRERLDELIGNLHWPSGTDDYFDALVKNLKQGLFRIVFAVDHAPHRLRSTVEFLNQELQDIEALVVEVQRYQVGTETVVSSRVFGYTDRIRAAKRESEARKAPQQFRGDFSATLSAHLEAAAVNAICAFRDSAERRGWTIGYGKSGNLNLYKPSFARWGLVTLFVRTGELTWNVVSFEKDMPATASALRILANEVGSSRAAQFPTSPAASWVPKAETILDRLDHISATGENGP